MAGFFDILPLLILAVVLSALGWIGYQMYLYKNQLSERAERHMLKHNISYSKDSGMKVGVKELSNEEYSAKTQNVLVNTWNESKWPGYKSRLWNKEAQASGSDKPSPSLASSSTPEAAAKSRPGKGGR